MCYIAQDDDKDHENKQKLLVKVLVPAAVFILLAVSVMCCSLQNRVLKATGEYYELKEFTWGIFFVFYMIRRN